MKKYVFYLLVMFSLCNMGMLNAGNRNNSEYHSGYGNIAPNQLPASVVEYLDKNYPDHTVIMSKRKGDGTYFVKIRYNYSNYRSFYRSLVFNSRGGVIKG